MALQKNDKLNNISMPYEHYFGEMPISNDEKNARIDLAQKLEEIFLELFLEVENTEDYNKWDEFEDKLYKKVLSVARVFVGLNYITAHLNDYSSQLADEITNATRQNYGKAWFTSLDRAMYDAENEANSISNYKEQLNAVKNGYTSKTWVTMDDDKVRHTHVLVDDQTIGIFEYFDVGYSKMLYPKDANGDATEIVGCRCICKYS